MHSIGFGLERLGLLSVAHPRVMSYVVLAVTILSAVGATQLRFADDTVSIFRSDTQAYRTYAAFTETFTDASNTAIMVVDGDFQRADHWSALERLTGQIETLDPVTSVVSVLSLQDLDQAAGPPADTSIFDEEEDWEETEPTPPDTSPPAPTPLATPQDYASHPLNKGALLSPDLKTAIVLISLTETGDALSTAGHVKRASSAILEDLPDGMDAKLGGLPVVRSQVIYHIMVQTPVLLACGVAVGFLLGVFLLGVFIDAIVAAVMPIMCMLWIYGAFGFLGLEMTVLLNDLPLLVLALAFATSMHLVYAARRDLYAAGHAYQGLRKTILEVGPACALSVLTTMIAFLAFQFSGSEAIMEFGLIGAMFLMAMFVTAMLAQPVILWAALKFGWRPKPAMRGDGWAAKWIEAACVQGAAFLDQARVPVTLAAAAFIIFAAWAHLQVPVRYSVLEDIPKWSDSYAVMERLNKSTGGAYTVHLPLPIAFDGERTSFAQLSEVQRVETAVREALPGHQVFSPWTVVSWFGETDRPLTSMRLQSLAEATPETLRNVLISKDGTQPALLITASQDDNLSISALAERIETVAGEALDTDLTGAATGLLVLSGRSGGRIVKRLNLGLLAAGVATAVLVGIAFRSFRIGIITFFPNMIPILAIGASLYAFGNPLRIASALAMTVALGIAVDSTVHMINSYRHCLANRTPRAALARAMRNIGPVLIITSLVLMLGLAPAFWSWSPGISTFALFACLTFGIALVGDLVALPALLVFGYRNPARAGGLLSSHLGRTRKSA